MRIVVFLLTAVIGLTSCEANEAPVGEIVSVEVCLDREYLCIRLRNDTRYDFDTVFLAFPEGEMKFGSLGAGDTSAYRRVSRAYRYAYTEASAGEYRLVLQPFDYVGEEFLPAGIYTYRYTVGRVGAPIYPEPNVINGYLHSNIVRDGGGA